MTKKTRMRMSFLMIHPMMIDREEVVFQILIIRVLLWCHSDPATISHREQSSAFAKDCSRQ